mmetsp:Transcript_18291/g.27640  ORF Transcript_18291/g.27640 Transcript_18291/m.27640 type:complete len:106 (+) Transcript_18291:72-389(+)
MFRRKDCFAGYLIWCIPFIILFVVGSLIFQAPPRVKVHTEDAPTTVPGVSPIILQPSLPSISQSSDKPGHQLIQISTSSAPITAAPLMPSPSIASGDSASSGTGN